jgi:P4 family phage/plasmid primase-like protien
MISDCVAPDWMRREEHLRDGYFLQLLDSEPRDAWWALAECIAQKHNIKTIVESEPRPVMYHYNGGNYEEPAEGIIRKEAKSIGGKFLTRNGMLEVIANVKAMGYVAETEFDTDTDLLVLNNGILRVSTRELLRHDPAVLCRVKLPVAYDPDAACPRWERFLEEVIVPDDEERGREHDQIISTLQEYAGYCLLRDNRFEKSLMLTGAGANGKSVFLHTLEHMLGKRNVSSVPLQSLDKGEYALHQMVGKLANIHADLSDRAMKESGNFKLITSGDDVYVNRKYLNAISTSIYAKQVYSANKVPASWDKTPAFYRRWIIVNFPNSFEGARADKALKPALLAELPGVFNWALRGLERLLKEQHFSHVLSPKDAELRYLMLSSPVEAFVEMCLEQDSTAVITKDAMYGAFAKFAKDNGMPELADNAFARKLKWAAAGIAEHRETLEGERKTVWRGYDIRIRDDAARVTRDVRVHSDIVGYIDTHIEDNKKITLTTLTSLSGKVITFLQEGGRDVTGATVDEIVGNLLANEEDVRKLLAEMVHDGTALEGPGGRYVVRKN